MMNPLDPTQAATLTFPKLVTPSALEAIRNARAKELESYFAPIIDYCDRQQADDNLSQADFKHVFALRQALDALLSYDEASEKLLTHYRDSLAEGQRLAEQLVPSLDEALELAHPTGPRATNPVYRLGWYRGYTLAQAHYENVTHLYAKHASLPAATQPAELAVLVASVAKTIASLSLPFAERPLLPLPHPAPRPDANAEEL